MIVTGRANNRWKEEKVFYNSCIWIMVIFPLEQSQICNFPTAAHSQVRFDIGTNVLI
jgi:hypothetical protein